ncbi:uncharacterized protein LTHEOB_11084 [Lasiodiplodia theobromae]|uniref:uncharacterized protein n=1 Tax=Lasiodiplodia theobromae TaxID=45133 RepID=UPI0015C2F577|nr:uncharacterized protein LTHEOB_11084 [Lasiodiplodia theobromae]KAF4538136.1 hypothetical protein LTHEOB_11084 [Lasiodiplodia theobromae]
MASMPEASIFRSFATLNIRNLLYMQAELVYLEKDLHSFQLEDARAPGTTAVRRQYLTNWRQLSQSKSKEKSAAVAGKEMEQQQQQQQEFNDSQWRTMEMIREKLRIYNEAIIQTMKVLSASKPSVHDLRDIQEYLRSTKMANGGGLTGQDHDVWGCIVKNFELDHAEDLITLLPRPESDSLTQFVVNRIIKKLHSREEGWFQWICGRTGDNGDGSRTVVVNHRTIHRLTFVLTSGVASMLPVVSMVALQQVEAVKVHGLSLGLIAIFNFVLAVLLTLWTSVKRAQVFAVASAFAAVNVVFIAK